MPTTYAHWRFGDKVLRTLDKDRQDLIKTYRALYDIGVQGPDVFFHYNCLKSNDVIRYGTRMHNTPMREHLRSFRDHIPSVADRDAALAYLLGFLAHFDLDSYCHGYIDLKAEKEGPSHDKIEAQFDRFLLITDGKDPYKTSVTVSLHPTPFAAKIMADLYGCFDEQVMLKSVRDQVFYRELLRDSNGVKRAFLSAAMKAAGAAKYQDMMMGRGEHPKCAVSNMRLFKYFDCAAEHYPILAENMISYLDGTADPNPYFDHDFGPKEDWRSLPLLDRDREMDYQPTRQI